MKRQVCIKGLAIVGVAAALAMAATGAANKDERTVVFLGDSITHQNIWPTFVERYLIEHNPELRYRFVNAGVGGDTAKNCLNRLHEDVAPYDPDIIVIMFGMNDLRDCYWADPFGEKEEARAKERLADYGQNLRNLRARLLQDTPGARLIWCTPSIYDDTAALNMPCNSNRNTIVLHRAAELVRTLGRETGDKVVDFNGPMTAWNLEHQKADPKYSLVAVTDRTHPGVPGAFFMACEFLKQTGHDPEASDPTVPWPPSPVSRLLAERDKFVQRERLLSMIRWYLRQQDTISDIDDIKQVEAFARKVAKSNDYFDVQVKTYLAEWRKENRAAIRAGLERIDAEIARVGGLSGEWLRPQLHLTAPEGWINDPNGLSYHQGEWHCFAQHNPDGVAPCWEGKDICWYHWVSPDLLHWTPLGVAIHQDELGWCASGSAVTDFGNTAGFGAGAHVLVYSQLTGPAGHRHGKQCLAYSHDGRSYVKYAGNPVCETLANGGDRDPKVFWYGRGKTPHWVIVLYVEHDGSAYYTIYTSPDLKQWTFSQEFRAGTAGTQRGWLYECPGMEELKIEGEDATRWIIWSALADYYQLGTFDGYTFTPDGEKQRGVHLPSGDGFYAAQTFSGVPDGRCIWIAWFQNPPGNGTRPGAKWSQCLSIPQELSLRRVQGKLRLVRRPIAEFAGLRTGTAVPLDEFAGDLAEVSLKCKLTATGSIAFNLRGMKLAYDAAKQQLTAGDYTVSWPLREGGELALTVFIDRGSAEIFAQDGLDMWPVQNYPSDAANRSLSVESRVGVTEGEFKAWALSSIWQQGE